MNCTNLLHQNMFKLLYNNGPKNDMQLLSEIHTHNTRQSKNKNVFVSNLLSSTLSKSVAISCSKIWKNLPNNIKAEKRPKSFNKLVYDHLLNRLKCRYRRGHLYRQNSLIKRGGSLEKGCLRKLKRFRVALIRRNRYN